jgi:putative membrane protein
MQIANSKTREKYPLSTKKVLKKTISGALAWAILLLIIYGLPSVFLIQFSDFTDFIGKYFGLLTVGIFVLLFPVVILIYIYQQWYYAVYFYDLTEDYVIIRKGPITPREITIPYERIQDIYVDQDLLDRMFGLYDVHLSSATITSGMEAHIDGLEKTAADGLRALLLQTVSKKIGKNKQ